MQGVRCALWGADRPASISIAGTCVEVQHCAPCPSCARHCHKNANTNKPGITSHTRGAARDAARHLGAGDTAPECTVWQAATTGGVPAKYPLQPTIPYAPMPSFHIKLAVSETAELLVQFASDKKSGSDGSRWLKQAMVQSMCTRAPLLARHHGHSHSCHKGPHKAAEILVHNERPSSAPIL